MYKEEEINLQIFHFLDYSTGTSARRKTCTGLTYLLQDWCAIHSLDEVLQEVISSCYFVQISFEIALNRF